MATDIRATAATRVDAVPVSVEAALAEDAALIADVMGIEAQLGDNNRTVDGERMDHAAWNAWRRKAVDARRFKLQRRRFLKAWLHEQRRTGIEIAIPSLSILAEVSSTVLARRLAKRVGQLEAVYLAACAHADDPSEANAARYWEALTRAREVLGAPTEDSTADEGRAAD